MTKLITHLPNYLVRLSRWGAAGACERGALAYVHAHSVSGRPQGSSSATGVRFDTDKVHRVGSRPPPPSQLALGHGAGATLDHHPDLSTPLKPCGSLSPAEVSANRCSRLGCRPRHARKQTVIVCLPSIISSSSFFAFSFPLSTSSHPDRPGEQSRGPT